MYFGSFSLMLLFLVRPTTPVKCQWWLLAWDSYCSEVLLLLNFFYLTRVFPFTATLDSITIQSHIYRPIFYSTICLVKNFTTSYFADLD